MHKSSHTTAFLVFICIAVVALGAHNFFRYYLQKDYPFHVFTTCNPAQHSCFTADPNNSDPTFQSGMYEKVLISASRAPQCLEQHTCTDFSCAGLGSSCQISYCSKATLEAGESCTNPTP
jgi:hypothetical protein